MSNVVAVDLGGTNIRAARVDSVGTIKAREKCSTPAAGGMAEVVAAIARLVQCVRDHSTVAVGIGTPGVPDPDTGIMKLPACNIADSAGFPLTSTLTAQVNLPVVADNDGNLAALAESWLGAGRGERVLIIFTLGTGIGGGLVVNGQVYHGASNMGTEFGHVSIAFDGRQCACGGRGCVEAYASAAALGRDARAALRTSPLAAESALLQLCGGSAGIEQVDARLVCDVARSGDKLANLLLDRCCDWLACGIGSLMNALNPSCVILGGGMALAGELLRGRVEKALAQGRAYGPILGDAKLRLGLLGDDAGLLGAARLAWQRYGSGAG